VKVAFLLVTTTWFASADVIPVSHGDKGAAPVVQGGSGCSGCNSCAQDTCCEESWGHRIRARIGGLFHRSNDCCDSGCNSGCNSGCGHQQQASGCCDSGQGFGQRMFGKVRGLFHRSNDCCDSCNSCNTCGNGYGAAPINYGNGAATPKGAEQLNNPKDMVPDQKLPKGKEDAAPKGANLNAPPLAPAQLAPPVAPALQPAPAITPATPADLGNKERSPF